MGINEALFAKADEKLKATSLFRIAKSAYNGELIPPESEDFVSVRTSDAGFFESVVMPGEEVEKGQVLARIRDSYLGTIRSSLYAPLHGTVAFVHDESMTYENTAVLKLIREEDLES